MAGYDIHDNFFFIADAWKMDYVSAVPKHDSSTRHTLPQRRLRLQPLFNASGLPRLALQGGHDSKFRDNIVYHGIWGRSMVATTDRTASMRGRWCLATAANGPAISVCFPGATTFSDLSPAAATALARPSRRNASMPPIRAVPDRKVSVA